MSTNLQRLGNTLAERMKRTSNAAVPTTMELGTIGSGLSLTTDSIPTPIPKGAYMVNIMLTGGNQTSFETHSHTGGTHGGHEDGDGSHSHSGGSHSHSLPGGYRSLQSGDRVLVAWCGHEPVVIAIVTGS